MNGVKESNAKLVKWEDGSFTMFIGNEAFEVTMTENPHTYSYMRHRGLYLKSQDQKIKEKERQEQNRFDKKADKGFLEDRFDDEESGSEISN